ncbi:MAG TPA: DedA family protein/thiosulfate sulfurtransferase GlpE [Rhodocyclaceae bacterium]|jgi:membrane protein DedA with SNARE-associated domain/rhodanese-related sulfurtransferase|nr:DedA family protein/thiosulfate sulfurtransferase GlpE [Rhodocyclaceae bacterium]
MQHLIALFEQHGPLLVFFNVLVEQLGAPIPAIPALLVAGALSVESSFSWQTILILALLGSGLANFGWYLAGRRFGLRILGVMCRITLSPDACVRSTEKTFLRWGVLALLVARFIPGLSSVASPLAGAMRLPAGRFILFDTLGTALWAGAAIAAGRLLHRQVDALIIALEEVGGVALLIVAALFALYIAFRWLERQRLLRFVRIHRIDVIELADRIAAGTAPVVIDVRATTAMAADARMIPGARAVPLENLPAAMEDIPAEQEVVFYCSCPNDVSSVRATRLMLKHGYKRARPLAGGIEAWFAYMAETEGDAAALGLAALLPEKIDSTAGGVL